MPQVDYTVVRSEKEEIRITGGGWEFKQPWNNFDSFEQAQDYFEKHMTPMPGVEYGVVVNVRTHYKFVMK
jgi:hypothetical protein